LIFQPTTNSSSAIEGRRTLPGSTQANIMGTSILAEHKYTGLLNKLRITGFNSLAPMVIANRVKLKSIQFKTIKEIFSLVPTLKVKAEDIMFLIICVGIVLLQIIHEFISPVTAILSVNIRIKVKVHKGFTKSL
jgi:hypothetical protein